MQAVFLRRVLIITRWYWRCYRTWEPRYILTIFSVTLSM